MTLQRLVQQRRNKDSVARRTLSIDDLGDNRYDPEQGGQGMSWVNDLASVVGIPAGAATLAVAMYAACAAAEKAARPEALEEIGRILKDTSWERSVRPSAIVERIFKWTFGARHLSWVCVARSALASVFIASALTFNEIVFHEARLVGSEGALPRPVWVLAYFLILVFSIIPDYLALFKARWLISWAARTDKIVVAVAIDIFLSIFVSVMSMFIVFYPFTEASFPAAMGNFIHNALLYFSGQNHIFTWTTPCLVSTLFTSVWTALIVISTMSLKLLLPLHRIIAWFFDVDKHPVQAIGIMAAALVMIGSLTWFLVRRVI